MAIRDVIGEAIVRLDLENNASREMADAVAEFRAEAKALGREKAEIKVKADTSEAKRQLRETRAELKALTDAERAEAAKRKTLSAQAASASTRRLNQIRSEIEATKANVAAQENEVRSLERRSNVYQNVNRMATQINKERAASERDLAKAQKASADAAELARTATLRRLKADEDAAKAQIRYADALKRTNEAQKALNRAQGSDKIRLQVDQKEAVRQMEEARLKLEALGAKPIDIQVRANLRQPRKGLANIADYFGFTKDDQITDASKRLSDFVREAKNARVNIGPLSTSLVGLVGGMAALAPVITGVVGALGSLISVLGAGLGGALGVASAGLAGFGFAAAGIATTIVPFIKNLTTARADITTYNNAVAKYGENSKQASAAQKILNNQLGSMPKSIVTTLKAWDDLKKKWQDLTQSVANRSLSDIIGNTLETAKDDMDIFAKGTNNALTAISTAWDHTMSLLRTPGARGGINTIFENFDRSIPNITDGLDHLGAAFGRVIVNFSKYLPGLTKGFDAWAKGIDNASAKSDGFSHGVDVMVKSLQSLGHFTEAASRFLIVFFKAGVEPGKGFVDDMTDSLNKLSNQMDTVSGQRKLTDFFNRSIGTTKELWNALLPLISAFVQFAQATAPLANIALRIVSLFTKMTAALAGFAPLKWSGGVLLAVAILGRLTSALREGGRLAADLATKLVSVGRNAGSMGIGGAFRNAFGGGSGIAGQMAAGGRTAGAEIASAMEAAGTVVAERIGAATAGGGAVGGAVRGVETAGAGVAAGEGLGLATGEAAAGAAVPIVGAGIVAATLAAPFVPALVHSIKGWLGGGQARDLGQEFARQFTAPLGPEVSAAQHKALQDAIAKARNQQQSDRGPTDNAGRPTGVYGQALTGADLKAANARNFKDAFNVGFTIGNATIQGLKSVKVPTQGLLIQDFMTQLSKLKGESKVEAAKVMLNFASGLVQSGRLPRRNFDAIIATLEDAVPGLRRQLMSAGKSSAEGFATALKFDKAQTTVRNTLATFRKNFGDWNIDTKITAGNIYDNMKQAMDDLHNVVNTTTGKTRKDAMNNLHQLQRQAAAMFDAMESTTSSKMHQLAKVTGDQTGNAAKTAQTNMRKFEGSIQQAMDGGVLAVSKGYQLIAQATNAVIGSFGGQKIPVPDLIRQQKLLNTPGIGLSSVVHAGGGFIGNEGEKGRDTVPIIVGRGEAVLNHSQQRVVNAALANAGINGLPDLFSRPVAPHYMAMGGIAGYAKGGMVGNISAMIAEANRVDRAHFPYVWGGGHSGFTGGPFDCSGAVSDILHAGGVLDAPRVSGDFMNYGLPGPGPVTLYANPTHVYMSINGRYFGTSNSNPGGGAGWFPGGPRPGFAVRHIGGVATSIKTPKVTGKGAIADIARSALGKVTKAANNKISRAMAKAFSGNIGGGQAGEFAGGPVVTASDYSGGRTADGQHIASRDMGFAELSNNYNAPVSQLDFSALGHLPFGSLITVSYGGRSVTIPKIDVGAGGPGLHGHVRAIDLTMPAANALGFSGLADVSWHAGAAGGPNRGGHFASGGYVKNYEPLLQTGFSSTTALLRKMWGVASPYYHRAGAAMPKVTYTTGNDALFVGVDATPGVKPGKRDFYLPDWIVKSTKGKKGVTGLDKGLQSDPSLLQLVLHEWAHEYQRNDVLDKLIKSRHLGNMFGTTPWVYIAEGSAESFAEEIAPKVLRTLGVKGSPVRDAKGALYWPYEQWVKKNLGWNWINNVQFGSGTMSNAKQFSRGGMFSRPTYLVGEENSKEYVISTNPTYAHANRGYLGQAANHFGYNLVAAAAGNVKEDKSKKKPPPPKKKAADKKSKPKPNHGNAPLLPPKDRIGGVGTDDIQARIDSSQKTYDDYRQKIFNQEKTVGKGKKAHKVHVPATAAQKKKLKGYGAKVDSYKAMMQSANQYIQDFTNLETEIDMLGTLMDLANGNPNDTARGYDPVSKKTVTKTWAGWQSERLNLEKKHSNQLRKALSDAKRRLGKSGASGAGLSYILALAGALDQSVQGEADIAGATDENAPVEAATADDLVDTLGLTDFLAGLNEQYALAQLNNVEDLPGTPQREDLDSLSDDVSAAQNLVNFYDMLLGKAQGYRWQGQPVPALVTDVANAEISAKQTLQGLTDQFTQAANQTGPTQVDLFNTAAASLLSAYGGNAIGSFVVGPAGTIGGLAMSGSPSGGSAGLAQLAQGSSPVSTGTTVNVTNHFQQPPEDPHLWSQGVAWELQSAL